MKYNSCKRRKIFCNYKFVSTQNNLGKEIAKFWMEMWNWVKMIIGNLFGNRDRTHKLTVIDINFHFNFLFHLQPRPLTIVCIYCVVICSIFQNIFLAQRSLSFQFSSSWVARYGVWSMASSIAEPKGERNIKYKIRDFKVFFFFFDWNLNNTK